AGNLHAMALPATSTAWTFAGDGTLVSAPLVVGQQVYVGGTSGMLYALDASTGRVTWRTNVGASIPDPDQQIIAVPTGLNAGDGLLVVPAGNLLVAYAHTTPTATPTP